MKNTQSIESLIDELKNNSTESLIALAKIEGIQAIEAILKHIYSNKYTPIYTTDEKFFKPLFKDYTDLIFSSVGYGQTVRLDVFEDDYNSFYYYLEPAEKSVEKLCNIETSLSNNLLHLIASIPDKKVGRGTVQSRTGEWDTNGILSFQSLRSMAQAEITRRGKPKYDSNIYITPNAWKIS